MSRSRRETGLENLNERNQALYRAALADSNLGSVDGDALSICFLETLRGIPAATVCSTLADAIEEITGDSVRTPALVSLWPLAKRRFQDALIGKVGQLAPEETVEVIRKTLKSLDGGDHPGILRACFRRLARREHEDFITAVNASAVQERVIVFVTSRTDYKPLREAMALGDRGYTCFLIHLEPLPDLVRPLFEDAFRETLDLPFSPLLLGSLAAELAPFAFHIHCAMWHYVLSGVVMDNAGTAAVACEYNDITSFYAPEEVMSRHFPPDTVALDLAMEEKALRAAGIVIHQNSIDLANFWRDKWGGSAPIMQMQPYVMTDWIARPVAPLSAGDGIIRMVWAGQVPGRIACPPEIFDSYQLGDAMERLLEQGFGVVAYQNPMFTFDFSDPNFAFYGGLAAKYPHFELRPGLRVDQLPQELAAFDFGIVLFDFSELDSIATPGKNKTIIPNKVFSYLEAGIPLIVTAEYEGLAWFVTENGFGIAVKSEDIPNLTERVREFDVAAAKARIAAYQRDHCMEREIERLIAAYENTARVRSRA